MRAKRFTMPEQPARQMGCVGRRGIAWRGLFQGSEPELLALSDREFISLWSALFGGPPAAMINRST
jgi:hypothetical protein